MNQMISRCYGRITSTEIKVRKKNYIVINKSFIVINKVKNAMTSTCCSYKTYKMVIEPKPILNNTYLGTLMKMGICPLIFRKLGKDGTEEIHTFMEQRTEVQITQNRHHKSRGDKVATEAIIHPIRDDVSFSRTENKMWLHTQHTIF